MVKGNKAEVKFEARLIVTPSFAARRREPVGDYRPRPGRGGDDKFDWDFRRTLV